MKIRTGFVSNSSSSSFLMYGICCDSDSLTEMYKNMREKPDNMSQYAKDLLNGVNFFDDLSVGEQAEIITSLLGKDYKYWSPSESSSAFIGRSWDSVKDDETGLQFKQSVERDMKAASPDLKIATHEEAWYDG